MNLRGAGGGAVCGHAPLMGLTVLLFYLYFSGFEKGVMRENGVYLGV